MFFLKLVHFTSFSLVLPFLTSARVSLSRTLIPKSNQPIKSSVIGLGHGSNRHRRDSSTEIRNVSTTGSALPKINGVTVAELAEFTPAHDDRLLNNDDKISHDWATTRSGLLDQDNDKNSNRRMDQFWPQHFQRTNRLYRPYRPIINYNRHHRYPIRRRFPARIPYQNHRPAEFVPASRYNGNLGSPVSLIVKGETPESFNIPLWNLRSVGATPRFRIFSDTFIPEAPNF